MSAYTVGIYDMEGMIMLQESDMSQYYHIIHLEAMTREVEIVSYL